VGWAAAFLYTVCGALRLARFNIQQSQDQDERISKRYFQGLPIPAAAGILAAMVLFYTDLVEQFGGPQEAGSGLWRWVPLITMFVLAILMVSTIRFRSFKDVHWHRQRPFLALVGVVVFIAVLMIQPPVTLFVVAFGYLLSGYHSHKEFRRLLAEGKETEEDDEVDDEVEDLAR
jgi:CDP-diacylglycerol--serine O-phosphatidyltransferase